MKSSGIGGQAVMEGVMMKNKEKYAVAVRKPDKEIVVDIQEYKSIGEKYPILKLPILRGVVAFIESMVVGIRTLTYSASFFDEEPEQQKNAKASEAKKKKSEHVQDAKRKKNSSSGKTEEQKAASQKKKDSVMMAGTVCLSLVLAIAIFMLLPYFLSQLLSKTVSSTVLLAVFEGVIRVMLFIGYVAAISLMKDIKRVFMYHGAEHKTINCIEHGYDLTVENVRRHSKQHKRCGTSFLLMVMLISIIFFIFIRVDTAWLRVVIRLILIPVIAGISYEFIKLAGRSESKLVNIISKPGLWLQALTTREPDDSMIEVAIASVEAVFDWKAFLEKQGEKTSQETPSEAMPADIDEKRETAATKVEEPAAEDITLEANKPEVKKLDKSPNEWPYGKVQDDDEDDEILKALDQYFVRKKKD